MDINQVAVELGLQEFGPSPHQVSCPRSKAGGGGEWLEQVAKREVQLKDLKGLCNGCLTQMSGDVFHDPQWISETAGNMNRVYTVFSLIHTCLC